MSYAILFPGQGSQHPDMLPWLEADTSAAGPLQALAQHLGTDWRARLGDPDELSRNRFAQVLITGVSLAAWGAVSAHLAEGPAIVAGYSVGELAAVACAGAFDPAVAVALAAQRAQAMDAAAGSVPGGLLSVSGLHQDSLARQLAGWPLEVAIRIGPDHLILAGSVALLQQAEALLAAAGGHCKPLPIRIASHSSALRAAAESFAHTLAGITWQPLRCAVAANASGAALRRVEQMRPALSQQIDHTVQWSSCLETLAERQVDRVIEIGPGRALSAMWSRQHPQVPVRALEDFRSPRVAADWLMAPGA
ncbi:ACP S-malonyltransferase [Curvibacter gracilis]|uniref:ACP S-malonyltransferase n=1 Tax=Curvibacter gracilis TaxID=230310 RepID=UPI00047F3B08|nr:acyltransferase domain-containing protein [Curvibacter gracilis]